MAFRASLALLTSSLLLSTQSALAVQVEGARAQNASARAVTALDRVLLRAGSNRAELESALNSFDPEQQPAEFAAMEWLVAGLDRHGYAKMAWFDQHGQAVEIPAHAFASEEGFEFAWAELVREHGDLRPVVLRLEGDALSLTGDELTENVRLAVQAWRERPWASEVEWSLFLEAILPHRVGDEPLENWRRVLLETFAELPDQLDNPNDPTEAADWIRRSVRSWVEHAPQYAWHLSDQSLSQMLTSGFGRAEDLAHLELMALRANAIPAALDYIPAWAARAGNHAWTRLLHRDGLAEHAFANRVAKVYRRTFQSSSSVLDQFAWQEEPLPGWLADERMRDVTGEYTNVASVAVPLATGRGMRRSAAVFACVWSDSAWTPVALGRCTDESSFAEFEQLGVGVVYLPAWHDGSGLHHAGAPFVVEADGRLHILDGLGVESPGELRYLEAWAPAAPADAGWAARAAQEINPNQAYEVLVWIDGEWSRLPAVTNSAVGAAWSEVPLRRLCILRATGQAEIDARPFCVDYAGTVWW